MNFILLNLGSFKSGEIEAIFRANISQSRSFFSTIAEFATFYERNSEFFYHISKIYGLNFSMNAMISLCKKTYRFEDFKQVEKIIKVYLND